MLCNKLQTLNPSCNIDSFYFKVMINSTTHACTVATVAKLSTTVYYIYERSILIEYSPKVYCRKLPYEKQRVITKPPMIIK